MTYNVGDIVLTGIKSQGMASNLIKFGSLVAGYPPEARRFAHCATVYDPDGTVCEANKEGIELSPISRFPDGDTVVIPMGVDDHDAAQIRAYCDSTLGMPYGFGAFAACGFNCLAAGLRFGGNGVYFGIGHTRICSVHTGEALARAGVIWDEDPSALMPASIWMQFGYKARSLASYRKD